MEALNTIYYTNEAGEIIKIDIAYCENADDYFIQYNLFQQECMRKFNQSNGSQLSSYSAEDLAKLTADEAKYIENIYLAKHFLKNGVEYSPPMDKPIWSAQGSHSRDHFAQGSPADAGFAKPDPSAGPWASPTTNTRDK